MNVHSIGDKFAIDLGFTAVLNFVVIGLLVVTILVVLDDVLVEVDDGLGVISGKVVDDVVVVVSDVVVDDVVDIVVDVLVEVVVDDVVDVVDNKVV